MAFVHRRSRSENDKNAVAKTEPAPVPDRDCGCEESSGDEDFGCDGQAAEPTWFPEAAPTPDDSRDSGHSHTASPATSLDHSTHGNCGWDSNHHDQTSQPTSSPQAVLLPGGSRLTQHAASPAIILDRFTDDNCVLGCGPVSSPGHPNHQAYHSQYYYPISASFSHPQYAHPTPMPLPVYGYHPQTFYPIPEEAAGLHWQQHGGEEQNPKVSPDHGEGHDIRERRVYLGNLRYTATAKEIKQHLDCHGLGQGAETIFMAPAGEGRNRGFCFVTYDSPDRAQEAMEHLGGSEHLGRKLICRPSLPRGMHYEPSSGVRPESKAASQARKHENTGRPPVLPPNRPGIHRIPFEDVGTDDYVLPPYNEAKVFSPKRDWISAGRCVVEVANLPPMPGEGACLREMELLFNGFDV